MQQVTGELGLAFLLDLWIGDPAYPFHPVRLMGQIINTGENFLRNRFANLKIAGAILAIGVPLFVFSFAWFLIALLNWIHPALGFAAGLFGIYSSLSIKDLQKEAWQILNDLRKNNFPAARQNLSRIVGRDTESLEKPDILRASVETVSESTVDGIIAPLFFAALGGAPLALAYKAVNTLDSMIGHMNERYREFGFFAAKQDELWNWIPARLSFLATIVTVALTGGGDWKKSFRFGWRDGVSKLRGNSAIPEASFAGALGIQLGGPSTYQGRKVEKPFLAEAENEIECDDLEKSIHLMMGISWLSLAFMLGLRWVLKIS